MEKIKSLEGKFTFEIYSLNEDIKSQIPTIFFTAKPLSERNNSKFPYTILAGYKTINPYFTFNSGLPFIIKQDEVILLLIHDEVYDEFHDKLDLIKSFLKMYYNVPYYDCKSGEII